nr:hypothetical protein [Tanacetum cinerariifolium]
TQDGMVNEGIPLDAGLDSEASTYDNTSTEHQDGSSISSHVTDAETTRFEMVVVDKENADVSPLFDNNTLTELKMKCLYKEDDEKIFTSEEPFEELGSDVVEVPALKDEEFAQIIYLGEHVSFPNGIALSFVLSLVRRTTPRSFGAAPDLVRGSSSLFFFS